MSRIAWGTTAVCAELSVFPVQVGCSEENNGSKAESNILSCKRYIEQKILSAVSSDSANVSETNIYKFWNTGKYSDVYILVNVG